MLLEQEVEDLTQDEDALPVKRSKHFAGKDVSASKTPKAGDAANGTKRKSPAKAEVAKPATAKAAKSSPSAAKAGKASTKGGKGRRTIVLDDDSDDDFQVWSVQLQLRTLCQQQHNVRVWLLTLKSFAAFGWFEQMPCSCNREFGPVNMSML